MVCCTLSAGHNPWWWLLPVLIVPPAALVAAWALTRSATTPAAPCLVPSRATRFDRWTVVGAALFVVAYVYAMFLNDELVGIDIAHLTVNRIIDPVIAPESGRFFPLGFQAYNLIGAFGKSVALYHAWATFELFVVALCVRLLLREVPLRYGVLAIVYVITLPSIAYVFMNVPYPERDIIVCIALWMVALERFRRTEGRVAFVASLILAQLLLYQKETSFVLLGAWSGATLLHRFLNGTQRRLVDRVRASSLELAHLALCVTFLAVYAVVILPHVTVSYAASGAANGASYRALLYFARNDLVIVATTATLAWRIARRRQVDPWDCLAIGAIAFAAAFIKLGMARDYYLAPADFVGVLYVGRILCQLLPAWPRVASAGLSAALLLSFVHNLSSNADWWSARRSTVAAYVQLEDFLRREAGSRPERAVTLYFPQPGGFEVMEFAAFLHFRGWTAKDGPAPLMENGPSFTLKSRHRYRAERCFPSQAFRCRPAAQPEPGDLVVLLPGRSVTLEELSRWYAHSEPVFFHASRSLPAVRAMRSLATGALADISLPETYVLRSRGDATN